MTTHNLNEKFYLLSNDKLEENWPWKFPKMQINRLLNNTWFLKTLKKKEDMSTKKTSFNLLTSHLKKRNKKFFKTTQDKKEKEATYIVYLANRKRIETRDADQL